MKKLWKYWRNFLKNFRVNLAFKPHYVPKKYINIIKNIQNFLNLSRDVGIDLSKFSNRRKFSKVCSEIFTHFTQSLPKLNKNFSKLFSIVPNIFSTFHRFVFQAPLKFNRIFSNKFSKCNENFSLIPLEISKYLLKILPKFLNSTNHENSYQ